MEAMRRFAFRQWVACVTTLAMLLSMATPLGICRCVGCHCENSLAWFFLDFTVEDGKCSCTSSEPLAEEKCCELPGGPCSCLCCDGNNDDAVIPMAVLLVKQPNVAPSWDFVEILPVNDAVVSRAFSLGNHRALPPPHVPLHVLLCVFLN